MTEWRNLLTAKHLTPFLDAGIKAISAVGESGPPRLTVETMDNHIYFYSDVDSDRSLALMRTIRDTDAYLRNQQITRCLEGQPLTPIWLHIHSPGGDMLAGFALSDQLRTIKTPIYSVVEGYCASAATLISLACTKRFITPSSFMLIHQLSSWMMGSHEEFKDEVKLQEKLMAKAVAFYAERTGQTTEWIKESLLHDYWMDANEAVERGFVDSIFTGVDYVPNPN